MRFERPHPGPFFMADSLASMANLVGGGKGSFMNRTNSAIPGPAAAARAFTMWAAALAATSMLFLAPAVSADALICEVPRDGSPRRYLIDIDDRGNAITVVNADTNHTYPITVGELTPERLLFAFNGIRMDAAKFVRHGKVVNLSVTTHADALLDRSTNTLTEIGYLTDERGEILSLEQLKAMQAEEEAWLSKRKGGSSHSPMFWLFIEAAIYRYDGLCRAAPSRPGTGID